MGDSAGLFVRRNMYSPETEELRENLVAVIARVGRLLSHQLHSDSARTMARELARLCVHRDRLEAQGTPRARGFTLLGGTERRD
jgi:hypothetical protein